MASNSTNGGTLGFEQTLWAAADKLRGHLDAAEYKHVVLGLIFLKYISDAFQEIYDDLAARQDSDYTDPEDRDEYLGQNAFWVPPEARWPQLQAQAKSPKIGILIDEAMLAIERDNPQLKGVLSINYGRDDLDKRRLGELIDLIGTIGLGDAESRSKDILGKVYEYFLGQFAAAEGKKGGEFYTATCVVRVLVEMLEPYRGRVYDPCCGSGGMFVQSERFIEAHGGQRDAISIFGQESNPTTWKLCKMNLAIRGIDPNLGPYAADSFHNDLHPDLKADYILANPPFNMSDWGGDLLDTAVVPDDLKCALGQNLVILRSDGSQVEQGYLRWALQGPDYWREVDKYLNVGAVFDSLNCADIPKFEVPVPPLPEQRAIAHILGSLDDKIVLNRRFPSVSSCV